MTDPDGDVREEEDEFRDTPLPAATRLTKSSSGAVTALGAAMIAFGELPPLDEL